MVKEFQTKIIGDQSVTILPTVWKCYGNQSDIIAVLTRKMLAKMKKVEYYMRWHEKNMMQS